MLRQMDFEILKLADPVRFGTIECCGRLHYVFEEQWQKFSTTVTTMQAGR